jgi:uncharacterized membrane protein HdeD (DUF308 family)
MRMAVSIDDDAAVADSRITRSWWLFLITGICWALVAFVVLAFDPTSAATIGYLTAFFLIFAGINELVSLAFVEDWKWLRVALGVTFVIAGFMALAAPFQTFGILALLIGWYLLFKGITTIILSIAAHEALPLWGFVLVTGVLEAGIGIWAIGYPWRSAWLLVLWVGVGAILRSVSEIVLAFKLRGARHAIA